MLNINLKKIKAARQGKEKIAVTSMIDAASYGYDSFHLLSPCAIKGELTKAGELINITGEVSAKLEIICDCCGEPFSYPLNLPFDETYSDKGGRPDEKGERDIHFASGESVDIAPEILSQFFLELPMKALCRKDCRGLCQFCGQNLNLRQCSCGKDEIDPRLEKLRELNFDGQEKGV